jgi:hypothetical protein
MDTPTNGGRGAFVPAEGLAMASLFRTGSFALAFLCAALGACKSKSTTVVGSCDEPKQPADPAGSRICSDYYDKKLLKSTCTGWHGALSDRPCDRSGAVGACKEKDATRWYYADSYLDAQGLSKICGSDPVILPSGETFKPKSDKEVNADKVVANVAQYGAKVKASIATVAAIARKPLPAPTNKVDMQGLKGEALVMHSEDLADPEHPKTLAYRLADSKELGDCARVVGGRATPRDDGLVLYTCATRPLLAVVAVRAFKEPTSAGQTTAGNTRTTFVERGHAAGDVLVFRLDDGRYLGGFSFDASNGPIAPSTTMDRLQAELLQAYVDALSSRAKASAPALAVHFAMAK